MAVSDSFSWAIHLAILVDFLPTDCVYIIRYGVAGVARGEGWEVFILTLIPSLNLTQPYFCLQGTRIIHI